MVLSKKRSSKLMTRDMRFNTKQFTENANYFVNFPEANWQVILFWWSGIMHTLARRYPHVFKVQKVNNSKPQTPMEIYTATTFMVGFPGETQEAFDELLEFTKDSRFERMGAFTYSEEEGTYAAIHYKDNIKESIKQARTTISRTPTSRR